MATATVNRGFGLARPTWTERVRTFWSMSWKTILEFSRYPVAFVALFVQIFVIIGMFMLAILAFRNPSATDTNAANLPAFLAYGFIMNLFLGFTLWEIGFSIREEQVRGTIESLYLTPANKFANLTARMFAILLWTSVMATAAIFVVGTAVGGLPVNHAGIALLVLGFSVSGFLGIGFAFAGVTIKLKETSQFLVQFLQFFFLIFCAQFFPFYVLPEPVVNYVSIWIPVSYDVDLFRTTLMGIAPELLPASTELVIVVLFGILSPALGYAFYRFVERRARREGSLGEY